MRKTAMATGVAILFWTAAAATAALPPQHQRARELTAVIEAVAAASAAPIEAVDHVGGDLYRVRAGACTVDARIESDPAPAGSPPIVGPRAFHVVLDAPKC